MVGENFSDISHLKLLNLHLNWTSWLKKSFKYQYYQMFKIASKLSTIVGEIFKYQSSQIAKISLTLNIEIFQIPDLSND